MRYHPHFKNDVGLKSRHWGRCTEWRDPVRKKRESDPHRWYY